MPDTDKDLIALEQRFWQTMVTGETDVALDMLAEPAGMVSSHGAMQFDHAGYRKMAENDDYKLVSYELSDFDVLRPTGDVAIVTYQVVQTTKIKDHNESARMCDSSTWVRRDGKWICALHTETPMH
jgi:hypothetical protein